jgi:hypothetical protein
VVPEKGLDGQRARDLREIVGVEQVVAAEGVAELPELEPQVLGQGVVVEEGLFELEVVVDLDLAILAMDLLSHGEDQRAVGLRRHGGPQVELDLAQVEAIVGRVVAQGRDAATPVEEGGDLRIEQVSLPGDSAAGGARTARLPGWGRLIHPPGRSDADRLDLLFQLTDAALVLRALALHLLDTPCQVLHGCHQVRK